MVLITPRESLFPHGAMIGFREGLEPDVWERLAGEWRFVDRDEAERTPSLKQIIPYVVLKGDSGYFIYRRLAGGGETRLRGRSSIGLGGHVSEEDAGPGVMVQSIIWTPPIPGWLETEFGALVGRGLCRELFEEVDPGRSEVPVRFLGVLNDEVVPVARVHFGFVFEADLGKARASVNPTESDQLSGEFVPADRVMDYWDGFEGWSQILVRALFGNG